MFLSIIGTAEVLIDEIQGGFRLKVFITNHGEVNASNVSFSIGFNHGYIFQPSTRFVNGSISFLPPGRLCILTPVLGFGITSITVLVWATGQDLQERQAVGFVLGPFIFVKL